MFSFKKELFMKLQKGIGRNQRDEFESNFWIGTIQPIQQISNIMRWGESVRVFLVVAQKNLGANLPSETNSLKSEKTPELST